MKISKAKLAIACLTIVALCYIMFSVSKCAIEVLYVTIAMILVFHDDIIKRRVKSETWKCRISRICGLCYVILMITTLVSSHRKITRLQQKHSQLQSSLSDIDVISGLDTTGILPYQVVAISNLTCELADANIKIANGIYEGVSGKIRVRGEITNPNWNSITKPTWEAGNKLFLSETPGEIETKPPLNNPYVSQKLGYIISIDKTGARIRFEPSMPIYSSEFNFER